MQQLPPDFKEFLQLLNKHGVEYMVVGGYAVGFYGYPRPTGDIDIRIAVQLDNAGRVVEALQEFGFGNAQLEPYLFLDTKNMVRLGIPPMKIEILTEISGVQFAECYHRRLTAQLEDVQVPFIHIDDLRRNKAASGRAKDMDDLEKLS